MFVSNYDKNDEIYNSYLASLNKKIVLSTKDKKSIKRYLKSSIANALFGDDGFYRVVHKHDKMIQKVLELETKEE